MRRLASSITVDYDVPMRLDDGTVPATDIHRPARPGRHPTILIRTP